MLVDNYVTMKTTIIISLDDNNDIGGVVHCNGNVFLNSLVAVYCFIVCVDEFLRWCLLSVCCYLCVLMRF